MKKRTSRKKRSKRKVSFNKVYRGKLPRSKIRRKKFKKNIRKRTRKKIKTKRMRGGTIVAGGEPPSALCWEKRDYRWKSIFIAIDGKSLNVYNSQGSQSPGSSIKDVTGCSIEKGEKQKWKKLSRKTYPSLTLTRSATQDLPSVMVTFIFHDEKLTESDAGRNKFYEALTNLAEGRTWDVSAKENQGLESQAQQQAQEEEEARQRAQMDAKSKELDARWSAASARAREAEQADPEGRRDETHKAHQQMEEMLAQKLQHESDKATKEANLPSEKRRLRVRGGRKEYNQSFDGRLRAQKIKAKERIEISAKLLDIDKQLLEREKESKSTDESKIIIRAEGMSKIEKTFNKLQQISGASFIRFLKVNGVNVVLIGDTHGSSPIRICDSEEERGPPKGERVGDWVRRPIGKYEEYRFCEDYNLDFQIKKHSTYRSFEHHKIILPGGEGTREYGMKDYPSHASVMDLVKFCIVNSTNKVEVFPEGSPWHKVKRGRWYTGEEEPGESEKYQTPLGQELDWFTHWNSDSKTDKGTARDKLLVHATDQRGRDFGSIDAFLQVLMGKTTDISPLYRLEQGVFSELVLVPGDGIESSWKDKYESLLFNLHNKLAEDPQNFRDIFFCLTTFGIDPSSIQNVDLPEEYLKGYEKYMSIESLCKIVQSKDIPLEDLKWQLENSDRREETEEEYLKKLTDLRRQLSLLYKTPMKQEMPVSKPYLDYYTEKYNAAEKSGGGLSIVEFLIDYFLIISALIPDDKDKFKTFLISIGLNPCEGLGGSDAPCGKVQNSVIPPYTTERPFKNNKGVLINRTTKVAKQLLNLKTPVQKKSLGYIAQYLALIGAYHEESTYGAYYYGQDFLYDLYTLLRLANKCGFKRNATEPTADTIIVIGGAISIDGAIDPVKLECDVAALPNFAKSAVDRKQSVMPRKPGDFLIGGHQAFGHPVQALKYLQSIVDLDPGRGGGIHDYRSDCVQLDGIFKST